MAKLIDVQNALVSISAQVIYPNGTSQPSSFGMPCRIYAGWPVASQLDTDLTAGTCHVTVYPLPTERNTSRYPRDWQTVSINNPTIAAVISGLTITLSGTISTPQNVGAIVNGLAFIYPVQLGDSLNNVATGLATLINAAVAGTTSTGAVITFPAGSKIKAARTGAQGTSIRELKRQERAFQITVWANTPQNRDSVSDAIDVALSSLTFVSMPDGSAARITYKNSPQTDAFEKAKLYRRDFIYSIEYATTQTETDTAILVIQENVSNQPDGATATIATVQINT
jgi:hypothetical protein